MNSYKLATNSLKCKIAMNSHEIVKLNAFYLQIQVCEVC